jgi:hypothetical protein
VSAYAADVDVTAEVSPATEPTFIVQVVAAETCPATTNATTADNTFNWIFIFFPMEILWANISNYRAKKKISCISIG